MSQIKDTQQKLFSYNIIRGKIAEEIAKLDYESHGYKVTRTGIGSDFRVIKDDRYGVYQEYVEVKLGKSRLTKKQQIMRNNLKRQGIKYSIYRVSNEFLEHQISTNHKYILKKENFLTLLHQGSKNE